MKHFLTQIFFEFNSKFLQIIKGNRVNRKSPKNHDSKKYDSFTLISVNRWADNVYLKINISTIHNFVNLPAMIRKPIVFLSYRARIFSKVWIRDILFSATSIGLQRSFIFLNLNIHKVFVLPFFKIRNNGNLIS